MALFISKIDKNGTEIERSVSLSSTRSANSTKLNSGSQNKNTTVRFVNSAAYIEQFSETSSNKEDICPLVDTKNNDIVLCLEKPTNYVSGLTNSAKYIEKTIELTPNNKEETCTSVDMKKYIVSNLMTRESRLPRFVNSAVSIEKSLEPNSSTKKAVCSSVNIENNDIVPSLEIPTNHISRFVNSAAYIEKILEPTSTNKEGVYSLLNVKENGVIPPLKIPTNRELSSSVSRYDRDRCKMYREARNSELAYTQWLEQKNKLLMDRTIKKKQLEEEKRNRKELQKSVSAAKVEEWFNKKKRAHSFKKIQESLNLVTDISKKETTILKAMQSKIKFLEWECNKEREERQKRLLKQVEIIKQRNEIEERKQKATEAWEAWIAKAAKKPKPVPLNRGLDSLRGAVSHSYVNPNQWQT